MLTSLCVSFRKAAVSFCGIVFPTKHSLRCWSSVSRLGPLGGQAVSWVAAEVGFDEMAPESRLGCGCCDVQCVCPFLLSVPTCWVCIVRACYMLGMAPAGLFWHTLARSCIHTIANTLHSSRHERSRVFKALALSGNSWLGRHGGSWLLVSLLLLFLPYVVLQSRVYKIDTFIYCILHMLQHVRQKWMRSSCPV